MRAMKFAAILLVPIALAAGSVTAAPPPAVHDRAIARLGETVRLHNVAVTPVRVLEDSRCPQRVSCVWAGRLRLSVRIGRTTRELTLGEPVQMVGGTLQLATVVPRPKPDGTIAPRDYRFGFRFDGRATMELIRN
jgi:hypothetical protein